MVKFSYPQKRDNMASQSQKFRKCDQSVKEMIVKQAMKDQRSYGYLAKEYGIPERMITTKAPSIQNV